MSHLIYCNLILMFNYYINVYLFFNKHPVFLVYSSMYVSSTPHICIFYLITNAFIGNKWPMCKKQGRKI